MDARLRSILEGEISRDQEQQRIPKPRQSMRGRQSLHVYAFGFPPETPADKPSLHPTILIVGYILSADKWIFRKLDTHEGRIQNSLILSPDCKIGICFLAPDAVLLNFRYV